MNYATPLYLTYFNTGPKLSKKPGMGIASLTYLLLYDKIILALYAGSCYLDMLPINKCIKAPLL